MGNNNCNYIVKETMGATFKYILVALILYYLWNNHLKKIIQVFFKGSSIPNGNNRSGADAQQQYRQQEPKASFRQKKSTNNASTKEFKGGEYVDFEEVD